MIARQVSFAYRAPPSQPTRPRTVQTAVHRLAKVEIPLAVEGSRVELRTVPYTPCKGKRARFNRAAINYA